MHTIICKKYTKALTMVTFCFSCVYFLKVSDRDMLHPGSEGNFFVSAHVLNSTATATNSGYFKPIGDLLRVRGSSLNYTTGRKPVWGPSRQKVLPDDTSRSVWAEHMSCLLKRSMLMRTTSISAPGAAPGGKPTVPPAGDLHHLCLFLPLSSLVKVGGTAGKMTWTRSRICIPGCQRRAAFGIFSFHSGQMSLHVIRTRKAENSLNTGRWFVCSMAKRTVNLHYIIHYKSKEIFIKNIEGGRTVKSSSSLEGIMKLG